MAADPDDIPFDGWIRACARRAIVSSQSPGHSAGPARRGQGGTCTPRRAIVIESHKEVHPVQAMRHRELSLFLSALNLL